ncbi:MAG: PhnE/PtxC family ABC transporter permease [Dehalococcoidia bacterium]
MNRVLERRQAEHVRWPRIGVVKGSIIAAFLLGITSWGYIIFQGDSGIGDLFSLSSWRDGIGFLGDLLGIGSEGTPAFLSWDAWGEGGKLAYKTLAMSILAAVFAGTAVLLTFLPGARNVAAGELGSANPVLRFTLFLVVRGLFTFSRAVPELIWAMIIIFVLSPGILPGAVALALHNYGILGKLCAEVVEDLDTRPARALRAAGAGNFQMFFYGILPQVMPQFLTYLLYRWEVIIRTTLIVGFVSAGGLGKQFRLSMSFFHYTDIALLLVWYVMLVIMVDLISAWLRRLAR